MDYLVQVPTNDLERRYAPMRVAGIDEAGRGSLAGPVVAACVHLCGRDPALFRGVRDSKQLSASARARLASVIAQHGWVGVAMATVEEIDQHNILRATLLAMRRAMEALHTPMQQLPMEVWCVDGIHAPEPPDPSQHVHTVVQGDQTCLCIAAASIIAKHTRDQWMEALAQDYPAYHWQQNKGYGTLAHRRTIGQYGLSPHHRRSFTHRPVPPDART